MENNTDCVANIKYNFLTPISKEIFDLKRRTWKWMFRCDCGNEKIIGLPQVKCGKTKSCGCLRIKNLKHGSGVDHNNWKGLTVLPITYINSVKRRSVLKNIEYKISEEYLFDLYKQQNGLCRYSNLPLLISLSEFTASIDRIDSSKGYIEGNVQWVHKDVNYIKYNLSEEEFIKICKLIYEKSKK
jgi:hypothetical protein